VSGSNLARRYAPLVAIAVLQLLIIGFVPSKAAKVGGQEVATSAGTGGTSGVVGAGAGSGTGAGASGTGASGSGAAAGGTTGSGGSTGAGGTAAAPPGVAVGGDTSHCVGGRQFDPKIAFWAPPCVPGKLGVTGVDNGGSTYKGVTKDTVVLVDYVSNYGAEVNAILSAQGSLVTYDDAKKLDAAWQKFINDHYQLYGRKVKIITYQGQCQSVPPDYGCLIPEMDSVVNTYHPFVVNWQTTLCSQCYAELRRLGVVAIGGTGFSNALSEALFPYFYGSGESSTDIQQSFAEFYCTQMTGPAKYAGTQNPAQNFNGKKRNLGIISTDDPDNKDTVEKFLIPLLKQKCGVTVTNTYFYAQDINTAAKQVAAGIAAMNDPQHPATTVLCLCDQVAPQFLFGGEQENNYYPENVIATDQGMDYDKTAQTYGPSSQLSCPNSGVGCPYDKAFGLGIIGNEEPKDSDPGTRIYGLGGGGAPPGSVEGKTLTSVAQEWIMIANLIEAAGPKLTPQTMAAQAPSLGAVGGPGTSNELLQFRANNGYWTRDSKLIFWNPGLTSKYNGAGGAYIQVGDRRAIGGWKATADGQPEGVPVDRK
jgi:hypothetical protein